MKSARSLLLVGFSISYLAGSCGRGGDTYLADGGAAATGQGGAPPTSGGAANAGRGGKGGKGGKGGQANAGGEPSSGGSAGEAGAESAGAAGDSGSGGSSGGAGSGGGGSGGAGGCPVVPALKLTRLTQLAQTATLMVQAPADPRLFFAERLGRILIFKDGALLPTPFLDIRGSVAPLETERGLLSIALHPDFPDDGRFYVVYTRASTDPLTPSLGSSLGDLILAEGTTSNGNPDVANPTLTMLLNVPKAVRYHNGGMIAFGQDGRLYMSTGEDGRAYNFSQRPSLQQLDNRWGKILRLDVDNPGTPPPGNLPGGDGYVWDYGFRNPWRMSFDKLTGDLYVGDVGAESFEKLIFEPEGQGQKNYGWAVTEGNHCSYDMPVCNMDSITLAVHEIAHDGVGSVDGRCTADFETAPAECNRAVIGGYVYRGGALPELDGRYFYGDYIQNQVKSLIVQNGQATCLADHTSDLYDATTPVQGLIGFSQDAAGEVYLLDIFANVYRIDRQ